MKRLPNNGFTLGQRLRRWPNVKPLLGDSFVVTGSWLVDNMWLLRSVMRGAKQQTSCVVLQWLDQGIVTADCHDAVSWQALVVTADRRRVRDQRHKPHCYQSAWLTGRPACVKPRPSHVTWTWSRRLEFSWTCQFQCEHLTRRWSCLFHLSISRAAHLSTLTRERPRASVIRDE